MPRVLALPLLVLAVGLGIVYVLWWDATESTLHNRQAELDYMTLEVAERIKDRMNGYDQMLYSLRGLFAEQEQVTRERFRKYVDAQDLEARYPGLRGLAFVPRVNDAQKRAHIAKVRRDGFPDYTIFPEGQREVYAPVTYIEPFNRQNARALGFDIYSEQTRREAMEYARDTGETSISAKLSLVQDADSPPQVGFLMVLSLYRTEEIPSTMETRRDQLAGWVDAVFDADNLMTGILGKATGLIDVEIFDDAIAYKKLLYDDDKFYRAGGRSASLFESRYQLEVGGRNWTLLVSSLPAFEAQIDHARSQFIVRSGLIVSGLLALLTWILVYGRARSMQTAKLLGQELAARQKAEESLRLAGMVYDNSSEGIVVTDANNHIIAINPAFTRLTGYSFEDIQGKDPKILNSGHHSSEFYRDMWNQLAQTGIWHGEIWDRRKDGQIHAKYMTINTIYNDDGSVYRRVALFIDISDKKKSEEQIWRQANFDSLTALPNRRMFYDRLQQDLKKSELAGLPLALLFIDLDLFKDINDSLGHHIGDELLVEAAKRITSCVREVDTVARLGGDEFTVILPELHDHNFVEQVAEAILAKLDEPYQLGLEVVHITGSIGITLFPRDATDPEALLRNADQAMYVAKNAGRKRFSYFTQSLQEAAQLRLRLVNEMHAAINAHAFKVYYQPIVDLVQGRVVKAEALVRWQNTSGEWVSPGEFIPLAEEAGLVSKIGDQLFEQTVRDLHYLRQVYDPNFKISVNTSPKQFRDKQNSPTTWLEQLRSLRLPGDAIVLEITEGLLLHAENGVAERLKTYRSAGMQIAIDDFGTGYSSLAYLKRFDIDYLKIDQSFVRDLEIDKNDRALSQAIIVMAHALGLKVIAEGVETINQLRDLTAMGCDLAQGYLFSAALPINDFVPLLQEQSWKPREHEIPKVKSVKN